MKHSFYMILVQREKNSNFWNIEMLELSQIWLVDGIFKTAPLLFEQVYCIHGLRGGPTPLEDGLLPSFFALLPNTSQETYMKMWEAIKQLCPHAHPMHLLMDFEKAAANAFSHFWPKTLVKGCFFHLTQNIFRKIQAEGLQHEYQHNEDFALQMKLLHHLVMFYICLVL